MSIKPASWSLGLMDTLAGPANFTPPGIMSHPTTRCQGVWRWLEAPSPSTLTTSWLA